MKEKIMVFIKNNLEFKDNEKECTLMLEKLNNFLVELDLKIDFFLASDLSRYITGEIIGVNGGAMV